MAIPKVLGCTRQSCSVWKLRVCMHIIAYTHIYIQLYTYMYTYSYNILCVHRRYLDWKCWSGNDIIQQYPTTFQELGFADDHNSPDLFVSVIHLLGNPLFFCSDTVCGHVESKTATGRNDAAPPRPSKRRPLQSLWSWWCCGRFEAGGHREHTATGDLLQKQPGNVVDWNFTKVLGVYQPY